MANLIVDGFATYGQGDASASVVNAMLSGAYSEIGTSVTTTLPGSCAIAQGLPWDPAETSFWINGRNTTGGANSGVNMGARRAIAAGAKTIVVVSCRVSLESLPITDSDAFIYDLRNGSNQIVGQLYVSTTGVLKYQPSGPNPALISNAPVIVAQKAHHIEAKYNMSTSAVVVKVDGITVINGTAVYTTAGDIAQFAIAGVNLAGGLEHHPVHMTDFILRDTSGTVNNDFVGDRRVATLYPAADDATNTGWTGFPLQRFGVGILDLSKTVNACVAGPASQGAIGNLDFTIEGNFRLQNDASGANKSVLFGKWIEDNNTRSYQLYKGGPSLETGYLVFRTSTNGQNGTVVEKLKWPWNPDLDRWYHIAVTRVSNVLRLFIDGVQAGIDVADSDTYFATSTRPVLGAQIDSSNNVIAGTAFDGWQDEFRLTVGVGRYTTNFTPPSAAFPRTIGGDPSFASVVWLSGWDNNSIADDGPNGITLTAFNSATFLTPNDGLFDYQTVNKHVPNEDTFIQAALIAATGILTFTGQPTNTQTVTLATKAPATPAVYTFKTVLASAFDVLIGATTSDSVNNLIAAINHAAGEGTLYGTGTTANLDCLATLLPTGQMQATALVPGTVGNALASTETITNASWGAATLQGGANIPAPSAYTFDRLPAGATIVDSVTFAGRQYKTDSGLAKTKQTLLGVSGGTLAGTEATLGTVPNLVFDTFEHDPDSPTDPLTPNVVRTMRVLINRTA